MMARLRRVVAFLGDPRVPKLPRFAVVLAAAYLVWPMDLLPDFLIPLGGYVDDIALVWMSLRWLIKSGNAAVAVTPPPTGTQRPQLPR
jgi:uncharacterized membrane protein YkvA (DUF1232 family)